MNDKKTLLLVVLLIALRTFLNWLIQDQINKKAQKIADDNQKAIMLQINTRISEFLPQMENTIDAKFSQWFNCDVTDK